MIGSATKIEKLKNLEKLYLDGSENFKWINDLLAVTYFTNEAFLTTQLGQ